MYCQKCGAENLENAAMCQNCGGIFVYSQPRRTSGTAITSMILGISGFSMFGVFGVTWIIGLIFGILALSKISKSGGVLKGKGFAITGVITSAVGLALVLTIFGVWMFLTSAQTVSLKRQIADLQDGSVIVDVEDWPTIEGFVYVQAGGDKSEAALFTPDLKMDKFSAVTTSFSCNLGGKEIAGKWQFIGKEDNSDIYNIALTVPIDNQGTVGTINKEIVYSGQEEIIYNDDEIKIFVAPPQDEPKDAEPNLTE